VILPLSSYGAVADEHAASDDPVPAASRCSTPICCAKLERLRFSTLTAIRRGLVVERTVHARVAVAPRVSDYRPYSPATSCAARL